jgi:hypothetical protein
MPSYDFWVIVLAHSIFLWHNRKLLSVQEYFDYPVNIAHECNHTIQSLFYLFMFCMTTSGAQTTKSKMIGWYVSNKLERM